DLDGIKLMDNHKSFMGQSWRAVAMIKHIQHPIFNGGHYVCFTREDDGHWRVHDDDALPSSIGVRYRHRSTFRYAPGA
ncbi:hypothetical protein PENTCL1PPCAC_23708, partial [Pristionchus entomophagus]